MKNYGKELIIDLHDCDVSRFNRKVIKQYFIELCDLIDMERADLHFWDDLETPEDEKQTEDHTIGTSAIQFIVTSNITIHTLDKLRKVFVNIFSCKEFDTKIAKDFTKNYFNGIVAKWIVVNRL